MSRLRRSSVLPRLLWGATIIAAPLSVGLAGHPAAGLWLVPWQRREPTAQQLTTLGPPRQLAVAGHDVVLYERGAGPTVLLVHGWADRATTLTPMIDPLVAAGYRVLAVDLPAHGEAAGRWTFGPALATVIGELLARFEPEAVIAHSVGAVATAKALRDRPSSVERVVFVAPAVRIEHAVERFGVELRLPRRAVRGLALRLERIFGASIWEELAIDRNLRGSTLSGLIVHDVADRRAPVEDARTLHEAWPGSRLIETRGLGHNRLLRDADVVAAVVGAAVRDADRSAEPA